MERFDKFILSLRWYDGVFLVLGGTVGAGAFAVYLLICYHAYLRREKK